MGLALAGCTATDPVGGGGGGGFNPAPITPQTIQGQTFSDGAAPFVEGDGTVTGATSSTGVSVRVVSASALDVTINGVTTRLTDNGTTFSDTAGLVQFQLFYVNNAGILSANQVQFLAVLTDQTTGTDYFGGFVDGNVTPVGFMPTSGTASYSGRVDAIDGSGGQNVGSISLNADFAAGTVGGSIAGALPAQSSAIFTLTPTTITGNSYSTTLSGTTVAVTDSALQGRFFGAGASETGGTFRLETAAGNAIGVFSAD